METKKLIHIITNIAVIVIGIYMVVNYVNVATPPFLSGIAFILIGVGWLIDFSKQ